MLLYWFSYAYNVGMAQEEGRYALEQARKYWKVCPIAYDFEYDSVNYARKKGVNITKTLATDMAIAFLQEVKKAGYIPIIYANKDYLNCYFDINRIIQKLETVYVWYARYAPSLSVSEGQIADIWQYTSSGKIPGISGKVDVNYFYADIGFETVPIANKKEVPNINILNFQKAANADNLRDADGKKLVEDGLDGPRTQYIRKKVSLKAKKTAFGWKTGSTGFLVKWWQTRCNEILNHKNKIDGYYGKLSRADTVMLQKKLNLKADGIAGYNSIQAVFYN